MKENLKRLGILLLIIISLSSAFGSGVYYAATHQLAGVAANASTSPLNIGKVLGKYAKDRQLNGDVNFDLFWQAWDLLEKDYVSKDKLSEKDMLYGAIHGLVASTKDPYTIFMDPKQAQSFDEDMAGTFQGIGAEIGIKKDRLVVIAPLPDSPAQKAGIRAGDLIGSINGTSTQGMTTDQAVNLIRGPKDTEVKLLILHTGEEKPVEIKIIRDIIKIKSVKTEMRKDGIFVITISSFNNDTDELFNKAVAEAVTNNPKGLIIDLRNNPGGYLETAINVASRWVDKGVIVSERFADKHVNDYESRGGSLLKDYKTVILVNEGSASASEIVSGALQDYKKATIIGKQTFGKGSVQVLENLKDGSTLKITVAEWLTPKGNNITEKGITPDKIVELTPKDYENSKDPQLEAALKFLKENKK
jgi:carboxyl-terminal processing protease